MILTINKLQPTLGRRPCRCHGDSMYPILRITPQMVGSRCPSHPILDYWGVQSITNAPHCPLIPLEQNIICTANGHSTVQSESFLF